MAFSFARSPVKCEAALLLAPTGITASVKQLCCWPFQFVCHLDQDHSYFQQRSRHGQFPWAPKSGQSLPSSRRIPAPVIMWHRDCWGAERVNGNSHFGLNFFFSKFLKVKTSVIDLRWFFFPIQTFIAINSSLSTALVHPTNSDILYFHYHSVQNLFDF